MWARGRCRISPPRFLAECCKRQLNHVSLVLLYFRLSAFSDSYWVCLSVFSCTVLFVSISQVIGCEDRLRNDLYCVEWGVKLYSNQTKAVCERDWVVMGPYSGGAMACVSVRWTRRSWATLVVCRHCWTTHWPMSDTWLTRSTCCVSGLSVCQPCSTRRCPNDPHSPAWPMHRRSE